VKLTSGAERRKRRRRPDGTFAGEKNQACRERERKREREKAILPM
jgi:hypothetical protein